MYQKISAANIVALQSFVATGQLIGRSSLGVTLESQKQVVSLVTGYPVDGGMSISQFRKRADQALTWLRALRLPGVDKILANPALGMRPGKQVIIEC